MAHLIEINDTSVTNKTLIGALPINLELNPSNNLIYFVGEEGGGIVNGTDILRNDSLLGSNILYNPSDKLIYNEDVLYHQSNTPVVIKIINGTNVQDSLILNNENETGHLAFNPSNGLIYFANQDLNKVFMINGSKIEQTLDLNSSEQCNYDEFKVSYNPSNKLLYFTNLNKIFIINDTKLEDTIDLNIDELCDYSYIFDSPTIIAYNPNDKLMYVTDINVDNIYLINNTKLSNIIKIDDKDITVEDHTSKITYNPNNKLLYITDSNSNNLYIINQSKVLKTLKLEDSAGHLIYNPSSKMIYIINDNDYQKSLIINGTNIINLKIK